MIDAKSQNGIVYLLTDSPAAIKRYDMGGQRFLSTVNLPDTPTAFHIDSEGVYVSFGRRTSHFDLNVANERHLQSTNYDVREIVSYGNILYLYYGYGSIISIDKRSGTILDWEEFFYEMEGFSIAPSRGRLFAWSTNVSPADLIYIEVNPDGTFGSQSDSPYHGDYPYATRTFMSPNQAQVADNAGLLYSTTNLTYVNSLGGSLDDMAFYGDLPIVLRGTVLYSYSNAFLETGYYDTAQAIERIFVHGDNVFGFHVDELSNVEARIVPIDLLSPAIPGAPTDPNGLAYEPDAVVLDADGIVHLLSSSNLSIFRWDTSIEDYIDTIPLVNAPSHMAYSGETHHLFLGYSTGKIGQIALDSGIEEEPFATLPTTLRGLATAGSFVFAADPSGAWATHYTFDPDGALVSSVTWNYLSEEYIWSEANGKMYFLRDDMSPNDLIWEEIAIDGVIGAQQDSPYHDDRGIQHPIRVSPDGSQVLLGSGRLYDGDSLIQVAALSNDISDGAWVAGQLFTLRPLADHTEVQSWGANGAITSSWSLPGTPLRLLEYGRKMVVITSVDGIPRFTLIAFDSDGDGMADNVDPDDDNDRIPDTWESAHGLNPYYAADARSDRDQDGFSALLEYFGNSDPNSSASTPLTDGSCTGDTPAILSTTYASGTKTVCKANVSITAGTGVTVGAGATTTYSAPLIRLLPGFQVEAGGIFRSGLYH